MNGKKFRVGCKKIFSLYPKILKDQVHKHRLDKLWSTSHKQNLAKVTNDIEAFESAKTGETVTGKDKLVKDNLDAGLDLLMQMDKKMQNNNGLNSSLSGNVVFIMYYLVNNINLGLGSTFFLLTFFDNFIFQNAVFSEIIPNF